MTGLIFLAMLGATDTIQDVADQALVDYVRTAYAANRASFPAGDFRFEFTKGSAEGDEAARRGQLRGANTAHGRYTFAGGQALYESLHDAKILAGAMIKGSKGRMQSPLRSYRILRDTSVALIDEIFPDPQDGKPKHAIKIVSIGQAGYDLYFPLEIGEAEHHKYSPAYDLDPARAGECKLVAIEAKHRFREREVVRLEFKMKEGKRTYWIDLERGAVPLSIRDETDGGGPTLQRDFDDLRFEEGAGWLPRVMTQSVMNGAAVFRLVVREVDLNPPSRDVFQLEFPEPRTLVDAPRNLVYTKGRRVWRLDELPAAKSAEARPMNVNFKPPPPMPGESPDRWPTAWMIVTVLASVGLIVWLGWAIRSRRGS